MSNQVQTKTQFYLSRKMQQISKGGKIEKQLIQTQQICQSHQDQIIFITMLNNQIISSSIDRYLKFWSLNENTQLFQLDRDELQNSTVCYVDENITVSVNGTIRIFDEKQIQIDENIYQVHKYQNYYVIATVSSLNLYEFVNKENLNKISQIFINDSNFLISSIQLNNKYVLFSLENKLYVYDIQKQEIITKFQNERKSQVRSINIIDNEEQKFIFSTKDSSLFLCKIVDDEIQVLNCFFTGDDTVKSYVLDKFLVIVQITKHIKFYDLNKIDSNFIESEYQYQSDYMLTYAYYNKDIDKYIFGLSNGQILMFQI